METKKAPIEVAQEFNWRVMFTDYMGGQLIVDQDGQELLFATGNREKTAGSQLEDLAAVGANLVAVSFQDWQRIKTFIDDKFSAMGVE